jgi:hypothetical protein
LLRSWAQFAREPLGADGAPLRLPVVYLDGSTLSDGGHAHPRQSRGGFGSCQLEVTTTETGVVPRKKDVDVTGTTSPTATSTVSPAVIVSVVEYEGFAVVDA